MRASTTKLRQLLVAVIAVIMGVGCATTRPASAAQVLILDPTVFGVGTPSLEAQIVTNPATAAIAGLSMSVDVVAASGWATALASTTPTRPLSSAIRGAFRTRPCPSPPP